jgi:hypothetical protein
MKGAFICVTLVAFAGSANAQAPQTPERIVGNRISGEMRIDGQTRMIVDTTTLTFQGVAGGPAYTIDFIARHPSQQPVAPDGVVDVVVTQQLTEDDPPEMLLRVDDEMMPVVPRLHGRRSVVATVSLAEFDRIAGAALVVDRTFGAELELGAGQVRMLRATADRWLGRVP